MYIQPNWNKGNEPLQIPENYSGTTVVPPPPPDLAAGNRQDLPQGRDEAREERRAGNGHFYPETGNTAADPAETAQGKGSPVPAPDPQSGNGEAESAGSSGDFDRGPQNELKDTAVMAGKQEKRTPSGGISPFSSLLTRFPFLSSLLPPKRERKQKDTNDILLIVGIILLLTEEQDDVLPLLLVLLLA